MFGSLSGQCHIPLRHHVVAEEVVKGIGKAAFQCGTRRHACAQWNVAGEGGIEWLHVNAKCHHLLADAIDVACPCGGGTLGVVEAEVGHVFEVNGIDVAGLLSIGSDFGHDALGHRAREHEASVVVGVLADEVDTPGRCINISCHSVKMLDEAAPYEIDFHRLIVF